MAEEEKTGKYKSQLVATSTAEVIADDEGKQYTISEALAKIMNDLEEIKKLF